VHLVCWISPCYGLFSLGACFETYDPFFNIFIFFPGSGKTLIIETAGTESADLRAHLFLGNLISLKDDRYWERINTFSTYIIKPAFLWHTVTVSQILYC
jgi:hypothetical protein